MPISFGMGTSSCRTRSAASSSCGGSGGSPPGPSWPTAGVLLLVGALLTFGQGIAWESMSDADRAQMMAMMTPSAEQTREGARRHAGQLRRHRSSSRSNRVHVPDIRLRGLFLLALQRHDAAGNGPVQGGLSRRTPHGPLRIRWSRRSASRLGSRSRGTGRFNSSVSPLRCRSARWPTSGITLARSSRRLVTRPCSSSS